MLFLNNWKGETMSKAQRVVGTKAQRVVGTKAQIVVDTYDEMRANDESYYTRYDKALSAAEYQGGTEIYNTNDRLPSCILSNPNQTFNLPNRIFKFDDGSYVHVTYGGAPFSQKKIWMINLESSRTPKEAFLPPFLFFNFYNFLNFCKNKNPNWEFILRHEM